jgi:hypothetical protein
MLRILAIAVAAAAFVFAGCAGTVPIQNVEKSPIVLPPGKTANMQQITTAIMRAGTRLGWQMQPGSTGKLSGRLDLRSHTALVDVEHDTKTYSIKYRDSTNLNAKDGNIHKNYNSWVQNLDKAIRAELTAL